MIRNIDDIVDGRKQNIIIYVINKILCFKFSF